MSAVVDKVGQEIEAGDHGVVVGDEELYPNFQCVRVIRTEMDSYGVIMAYVELAFKDKTNVEPARFYIRPDDLILTKTKVAE